MSTPNAPTGLSVWLGSHHVADLVIDRRGRLTLSYTSDAIELYGLGTPCLSVALPVSQSKYRHDLVFPWAEGMLPEGETRTVLEQYFRVRRGDTFGLLAAIGRDCAGAVAFLEPTNTLDPPSNQYKTMTSEEVDEAIANLPSRPLGVDDDVRVSLGGLQAKLLLTKTPTGKWSHPSPGTPSTHILKPESPDFPGLVAAEVFTLRAAKYYGMRSAEAQLLYLGGRNVLVVERFDRHVDNQGRVIRIHQEDSGQALSLDPSDTRSKYQSGEDHLPNLRSIAKVLRTHSIDPINDLRRLLEMTTLHIAIGNTDAHARNHGLLHHAGGIQLAPLYDAAPTIKFVSTRKVALWVDNQAVLAEITADHLIKEGEKWGLPERAAKATVMQVLEKLPEALLRAADETPEVSSEIVEFTIARTNDLQNRKRRTSV